jgi:hypothetical protein
MLTHPGGLVTDRLRLVKSEGSEIATDPSRRLGDGRPRMLMLDEGWPATLHLAYGLADKGCETRIVTSGHLDRRFLGAHVAQVKAPPPNDPGYGKFVETAVDEYQPDLVMPMTDDTVRWACSTPYHWSGLLLPRVAPSQRELLGDKLALSSFLLGEGVLMPRSLPVDTEPELADGLGSIVLPAVVK